MTESWKKKCGRASVCHVWPNTCPPVFSRHHNPVQYIPDPKHPLVHHCTILARKQSRHAGDVTGPKQSTGIPSVPGYFRSFMWACPPLPYRTDCISARMEITISSGSVPPIFSPQGIKTRDVSASGTALARSPKNRSRLERDATTPTYRVFQPARNTCSRT